MSLICEFELIHQSLQGVLQAEYAYGRNDVTPIPADRPTTQRGLSCGPGNAKFMADCNIDVDLCENDKEVWIHCY